MNLQVYDPAMCCTTGVCGPAVDPALVRFAADLTWLSAQGIAVARYNLAQNPAAYVENEAVKDVLIAQGEAGLPVIVLAGKVVATARYPSREELMRLCGLDAGAADDGAAANGGRCCG